MQLERSFAQHAAEDTVKVKRRQRRLTRQPFEIQSVVQIRHHVLERT